MADSINELELEREKIALERERLVLERERLSEMKKIHSEEALVAEKSLGHFRVAASTTFFLSIISLLAGGILGIVVTSWHQEQRDRERREQVTNALRMTLTNSFDAVEGEAADRPQRSPYLLLIP